MKIVRATSEIGYEDFLVVHVEFAIAITKPQAKRLAELYDGWKARVEKESRKIAKDDGEKLMPIRFDGLGVSGRYAIGGASRFLSAEAACTWLTRELMKEPAVVKLVFGEEDIPATPKAGTTKAPSAAAARMKAQLDELLGKNKGAANVLGRISIRFTGEKLASPSRAIAKLIDEAVALAGDVGTIWVRGTWGKVGSLEEANQGRDIADKTGRALLERILGDVPKMPKSTLDPRIVNLVLSDGPRPERTKGYWVDGSRIATSFGIQVRLEPMTPRGLGGHLEIYVPLDAMEAWVDFGKRAFEALAGSIGTFTPALWMEAIRPSDLPLELFSTLPMIAIPRIVGSHAGGFNYPDFAPDLHHGLFEPPWIAWVGGKAQRVEAAPPLEMNDARYRNYQKAWQAANRIRWTDDDDANEPWRHSLARFDALSFGALKGYLAKRLADGKERSKLHWSCRRALEEHNGKVAFAEATKALTIGAGPETYDVLLAAILCFKGKGKPNLALAPKALAAALPFTKSTPRIARVAALVYLAMGDAKSALRTLAAATPLGDAEPDPLELDPAFAPIHDDERFRRAFGWSPNVPKKPATPDLRAFPKFAKAQNVTFAPPASVKAIAAAEKALGVKLPAEYRQMLACFDGAVFGREWLYSTKELVAKNPNREHVKHRLLIGRNLVLSPSAGELTEAHYGARSRGTTLRWKKLDACLSDLAKSATQKA